MTDILFTQDELPVPSINPDVLHEECAVVFEERFHGISTGLEGVRFHFTENDYTDRENLITLMKAHNPQKLSAAQAKQKALTDAYMRFMQMDFNGLENDANALSKVIIALADIQTLMRGVNG